MNAARTSLALAVLTIGFSPTAVAAPACSANVTVPATARIFAKVSDESAWIEYGRFEQVPELKLESGMYALYWKPSKKSHSVYIVEPAVGFYLQTRYCFDGNGQLEGVDFEIGTNLGWGHRVEGSVASGKFDAGKGEFFRTMDGKAIKKPFEQGKIPHALKPTLYLTMNDLPFASLLGIPQETGRKTADSFPATAKSVQ
jgi:hypothetical protein